MPGHLNVDRRGNAEVQDLAGDVGGEEGEGGAGKLPWQIAAQPGDIVGGGRVMRGQGDQHVAILRAYRAIVRKHGVDAAIRQADVVRHGNQLVGGDHVADLLLDKLEAGGVVLDAGAGGAAHVQLDLPGVDQRKEILAEDREQQEGE